MAKSIISEGKTTEEVSKWLSVIFVEKAFISVIM